MTQAASLASIITASINRPVPGILDMEVAIPSTWPNDAECAIVYDYFQVVNEKLVRLNREARYYTSNEEMKKHFDLVKSNIEQGTDVLCKAVTYEWDWGPVRVGTVWL